MKEIISLQVGGYANFVGSHFWNIQDELLGLQTNEQGTSCFSDSGVDFDVLYRVGETRQGLPTYTPRLLAIDSRGSLGAVKSTGSLYDQPSLFDSATVTSWKGKVSKHVSEPHAKNEFLQSLEQEEHDWDCRQEGNLPISASDRSSSHESSYEHDILQDLEDTVQFWTDYSKVHFHPLSLFQLEGIWHEATPFDDYGSGKGIFSGQMKEDIMDRVRFFVEEADHMQGLQVLVDDSNGFAAIATELLEAVYDDYGKTPVMLFMARSPSSFAKPSTFYESTTRDLHDAISFSYFSSSSSQMIPLGLSSFAEMSRSLLVNDRKHFHTSAVYAAAISCTTLPLRMDFSGGRKLASEIVYGGLDMGSLIHVLLGQLGRQVSLLELALPAPPLTDRDHNEVFESSRFKPLLQGAIKTEDQIASEAVVVQGAQSAGSTVPARIEDVVECFARKNKRFYQFSASTCPLAIPLPFPNLFAPSSWSKARSSDISSIPIATKLSTSVSVVPYLEKRLLTLQQPGRGSLAWQVLEGWGLQKDDVRELTERMSNVVATYKSLTIESASDSE